MTANVRSVSIQRQRGNTLTGIIIGLIVGLAIAVAVALAITKGASPFTDKAIKTGRPADPEPGQAVDPNKPMYVNRDAAREANRELTEKANQRTAPAAAPAAPATNDADPLGAAIAAMKEPGEVRHPAPTVSPAAAPANAAAPATAPQTGGDGYIYYLQAGAFREMADAEATRAKLALLGFEASITDRSSDSGVLHRVRIGPYNQVESMNKARAKLIDSGIDVAIVRNQR
ncbi:SPOR domain-containing protein [Massilia horti]|uniref:SPOR domain-containing protein n=1 Tax=Massilia horti TaxID=2562153 RepID=A0A4Y9SXB6_9BURK|nr:SPOR domain-containing protein [Massilia horti]TFW29979.1 SPOR domain-containing protein [Massilia horti]